VLSTGQGRPPLLFIAPRAKLAVAPSLGKNRGHRTHCREPPDAGTVRLVLQKQPRVTSHLNSTVAANGYCARAPAQHHRTLYCVTPDASCAHRTHTQRVVKNAGSPDATTGRTRSAPDAYSENTIKSVGTPDARTTFSQRPVLIVWCTTLT